VFAGSVLLGGLALALDVAPAGATTHAECGHQHLVDLSAGQTLSSPAISGDGETVAFTTRSSWAGDASGNLEVYAADTTTGAITHVTAINGSTLDSSTPSLDFDGDRIAITSEAQQSGSNPDNNHEVYLGSLAGGSWGFHQVTTTTGGAAPAQRFPQISDDGTTIAFFSDRNIATSGSNTNPDLNREVFVWRDAATDTLQQWSDTTGASHSAGLSLSGDGDQVAFTSRADDGDGAPTNRPHLVEATSSSTRNDLLDGEAGDDFLYFPSLNRDGREVAFASPNDLGSPSTNTDGNYEIWHAAVYSGVQVAAITQVPAGSDDLSQLPASNASGSVVVFETDAPAIVGQGAGLGAARRAEVGGTTQLSLRGTGNPQPQPSATGNVIAYVSPDEDDGSEDLWIARCETFGDVGVDNQFWNDVEWMTAERISTGYEDGTWRPSANVSRQAMAAFVHRAYDWQGVAGPFPDPGFADVGPSNPFYGDISWMAYYGLTDGFPDGTFRPSAPVTRQSMSAFMYRFSGSPAGPFPNPGFSDVSTSHPFYEQIAWMADEAVTTGYPDGTFRPGAQVTRQAMSAFMRRLVEGPGIHI
jgi:Tol biopolymer transport system component